MNFVTIGQLVMMTLLYVEENTTLKDRVLNDYQVQFHKIINSFIK